ncbi:MAG: hypothetical protein ACXAE3_11965 [Candidatus Kariarchaeaceae archaeon]
MLLLCCLIPVQAEIPLESWTFDESLRKGNTYYWNVTQFSVQGQVVNAPSQDSLLTEGSEITITLLDDLQTFNLLDYVSYNSTFDFPAEYRVDGTFQDIERSILEFIYPTFVIFANGSRINLFDLDSPEYAEQFVFSPSGYYEGTIYTFEVSDQYSRKTVSRDVTTGILSYYLAIYSFGTIEYQYLGAEEVEISEDTPFFVVPLIIGLVIRQYVKRYQR